MKPPLDEYHVYCARAESAEYGKCQPVEAPELPLGVADRQALVLLRDLLRHAGLDRKRFGSPDWNPLGDVIKEGDKVAIKPNWVYHENGSGETIDCLVTNPGLIEDVAEYVLKSRPASVVIGDAPIQGCDFEALLGNARFNEAVHRLQRYDIPLEVRDFRCVVHEGVDPGGRTKETERLRDEYVLFDLGRDSALEPISGDSKLFRVTMYNPDDLLKTHSAGKHQYLVAQEIIEADVVINMPKLKSHRKACVTGALKNMVGVNGHKSFLPHHRKGGALDGGDCYDGKSVLKRNAEHLMDSCNRSNSPALRKALALAARALLRAGSSLGHSRDMEGSWYGNDTVWRTCLDLLRIVRYGRSDGTLAETASRKILTITDAVLAGQGEGPLSPSPVPLGMLTLGFNVAALEWVHALLMGFDPMRIPLIRHAFDEHPFPIAGFAPGEIVINADGFEVPLDRLVAKYSRKFSPPSGWRGHCELGESRAPQGVPLG